MNSEELSVAFDKYYTHEELSGILTDLCREHQDLVSMRSIGKSHAGRDIWVVTVTDRTAGNPDDKPACYLDGNHHAGEVTGSMVALYTIVYLVERAGRDEQVDRLLHNFTLYVVPRVSPDGAERYLCTPDMLRSSVRPWPARGDEAENGLHPEDVDDNGVILQMRVPNERGAWRVSERDPRLMVLREPGEEGGRFYDLYPEGRMRKFDGTRIHPAPPRRGLDFNRNYPIGWATEEDQRGAGPHPLSEPETHSIARFISDHPNIALVNSYHTTGGILLRPPCGGPDADMNLFDLQLHQVLGDIGERITGYRCASVFEEMTLDKKRPPRGSFIDFAYMGRGMLAFAPELWNLEDRAGLPVLRPHDRFLRDRDTREAHDLKILQWIDEHCPEFIYPWERFCHPQFGEVEIGGIDVKFVRQNPPASFLPQECHKLMEWNLVLADSLPRIRIDNLAAESVSHDLFCVEASAVNAGWLDTCVSSVGRNLVDPPEYVLRLSDGMELVAGQLRDSIEHLNGGSAALHSSVPDRARRLTWLVRWSHGSGEVTLEVSGDRCGRDTRTLCLAESCRQERCAE